MTNGRAVGPADGPPLLRSAITYALANLAESVEMDLARPTPCAEWDLRTLLDHMRESHNALLEVVSDRGLSRQPQRSRTSARYPTRALHADLVALRAAWGDISGVEEVHIEGVPLSMGMASLTGAMEIAVHAWDVGQACGLSPPLPATLAPALLSAAPLLVPEVDRPGLFKPALPVPGTASPNDQLLGFLGRCPQSPLPVP